MRTPTPPLLVLGAADLEALLPPAICIEAMEAAAWALASAEAQSRGVRITLE